MTAGYYRQPEATAAITLPGGWLDSGDLAYRADGEIYVCGRRKDLIIKGGRNLVPQEIEEAAAAVEGIRRGCVVAFGVPNAALGTEGLVVVAEAPSSVSVAAEIAARVQEECFHSLEAPVLRATGFDTPYPPSRCEDDYLPDLDRVLDAVDRAVAW